MHRGLIVAALLATASPAHADPKPGDDGGMMCFWQNAFHYAEWLFPDFRVQAAAEPGGGIDWDLVASWPVTFPFYLDRPQEHHWLLTPFVEAQVTYDDRDLRALAGTRLSVFPRWHGRGEYGFSVEVAGGYDKDSGATLIVGLGPTLDWGWEGPKERGGRVTTTPVYRFALPTDGPQRHDVALDTVFGAHRKSCSTYKSEY